MTAPLSSNKSAARSSVFDNDSIIMEKRYVTVTFFLEDNSVWKPLLYMKYKL